MKTEEIKLRLVEAVNGMIDVYFGGQNVADRLINTTLKIIVKQNAYRIEPLVSLMADKDGEVDPRSILTEYANQIPEEGITIDIRDYIDNDFVKSMLPGKVLILKRDDILNLIM